MAHTLGPRPVRCRRESRQAGSHTARDCGAARDRWRVAQCTRVVRGTALVKGDFVFAVPGDLDTPTGGYAYDKRMIAELRGLGWRPQVLTLGEGFPHPSALTRAAAKVQLNHVPKGRAVVIDGLAFGVMPDEAEALSTTHPLIAMVHHPLALESGVSAEHAMALRESERKALSFTHAVIVNSQTTAGALAGYGVPAERITIARPGTDRVSIVTRDYD